jgi:serine/threonine protein kinase
VIGEGAFGKVYRAKDRSNGKFYALKVINMESELEGIPSSAIREIALLKELNHPNIVSLVNVLYGKKDMTLVYDYLDQDLSNFITSLKSAESIPKY